MDILLTDIKNRLVEKVPALKYIDEDWGQLDDYSPNFPVKWPCSMVDCINVTYENLGNKVQMGLATIRVIVADVRLSNSSDKAPAGQKQNSNSFFTLLKEVYKALHGYTGHDHYTSLIRISERRIPRNDGVKAHEILFTVEIKDALAKPQKMKISSNGLSLTIKTEIATKDSGIGVDIIEDDFIVS